MFLLSGEGEEAESKVPSAFELELVDEANVAGAEIRQAELGRPEDCELCSVNGSTVALGKKRHSKVLYLDKNGHMEAGVLLQQGSVPKFSQVSVA